MNLKPDQLDKALEIVKQHPDNISVSLLQRYLRVGVISANKILEALENAGIIDSPINGKRELLQKGEDRVVVISIEDELGTHTLQANSFIVKCKSCGKERHLLKSDMQENNIKPAKCECGGANEFRYWLDNIYTEEEYEKLEIQAQIRRKNTTQ